MELKKHARKWSWSRISALQGSWKKKYAQSEFRANGERVLRGFTVSQKIKFVKIGFFFLQVSAHFASFIPTCSFWRRGWANVLVFSFQIQILGGLIFPLVSTASGVLFLCFLKEMYVIFHLAMYFWEPIFWTADNFVSMMVFFPTKDLVHALLDPCPPLFFAKYCLDIS